MFEWDIPCVKFTCVTMGDVQVGVASLYLRGTVVLKYVYNFLVEVKSV